MPRSWICSAEMTVIGLGISFAAVGVIVPVTTTASSGVGRGSIRTSTVTSDPATVTASDPRA